MKAQFNKGQRSEVLISVEAIEMAPGVVLAEFNRRKVRPPNLLTFHRSIDRSVMGLSPSLCCCATIVVCGIFAAIPCSLVVRLTDRDNAGGG